MIKDEGIVALSALAGILVLVGVAKFAAYRARVASKQVKKETAEETAEEAEARAKAAARQRREAKEKERAEIETKRAERKKAIEDARSRAKAETASRLKAKTKLEQPLSQDDVDGSFLEVEFDDLPEPQGSDYALHQKAQIVSAVRREILSTEEACFRYGLSHEEWNLWIELVDKEIERREDAEFFAEHDAWLPEKANVEVKRNASGRIVEIHFDLMPPQDDSAVTIEGVFVNGSRDLGQYFYVDYSLNVTLPLVISAEPVHFVIAINTSIEEIRVTLQGDNPSKNVGFQDYIELGRVQKGV